MQVRSLALGRMLHVLGLAVLLAMSSGIHAQNRTQQSDIHMVEGPDREQRVIEGAGKEGTVALYASLDVKGSAPTIDALETKYSQHKTEISMWRASGEKVVRRALAEARAGRGE
ncbi:MAG: Iron uptake protein [Noviherbaspirillum sp.]|nr:Iron uptake protein [Noviherbaspirillum sp.]